MERWKRFPVYPILLGILTVTGVSEAGEATALPDQIAALSSQVDWFWTCVAAFLVFFMQAGFAMVEAGFTRAKNSDGRGRRGTGGFLGDVF